VLSALAAVTYISGGIMKNNTRSYIYALAALLAILAGATQAYSQELSAMNAKEQIAHIQTLIKQNGAKWAAGETSLSNLSDQEWQMRLGFNFTTLSAPPLPEMTEVTPPASFDWRNYKGNYVTRVKNQAKCGSCWAFALTGALESYVLIKRNMPGEDLDLSEQVMLSCSGVGSCNGGYLSAGFLQSTGLPLDTVYPYTATDGDCALAAPDWQNSAYKVDSWGSVTKKLAAIKTALVTYGPLPTAFMVYEDFKHYKSGIYSYVTGKKLGGHAVLLVGYNDEEKYFIVKNSWDTGWGEEGFFRIAYSEMDNVVKFGLSTIAYKSASINTKSGSLNSDAAWSRTAPMFAPLLQWTK